MNTRTNEENILKIISKSSQYLRRQENGGRFFVDIGYSRYNSSPIQTNMETKFEIFELLIQFEKKSVISKPLFLCTWSFRRRMRDAQTVIGIIVPIKYRLPRFTWTRRSPLCTHHRLLYDHVAIILSRDLSYRKAEHDSSIRIHRRKIICGISSMRPSSQDSLLLSILLRSDFRWIWRRKKDWRRNGWFSERD